MWLRLYTEITRDRKLRRLNPSQRWLWVSILCLAKESPIPGRLLLSEGVPVTVEDLADEAAVEIDEIKEGINNLIAHKMLDQDEEGVYYLLNWDKRQFTSDNSTERSRKHREKKKTTTEVQRKCNVAVTPPETETETDTEKDKIYIKSDSEKNDSTKTETVPFEPTPQRKIFDHWNSKEIIKHRKLTPKIKRAINGALDSYAQNEIIQAIDNYALILNDDSCFWTHKWGLKEFIQRDGLERFLDYDTAVNNYKDRASPFKKPVEHKCSSLNYQRNLSYLEE